MFSFPPKRIICLTEETTETLYALGEDTRIVGISGFTVRPKIARKTKPKVSTYLDANIPLIKELQPDIVFAWSDLQAGICEQLIKEGIPVLCFNHRSIEGIFSMIETIGALLRIEAKTTLYCHSLRESLTEVQEIGQTFLHKPKVYFEEWYDPLISGITWVSELIELCGGEDIFAENRHFPDAKRRIIPDMYTVVEKNPDIVIASWCGKGFKPEKVLKREHWDRINAIKNNQMFEIHSSIVLQPGPAVLTEGAKHISQILQDWHNKFHNKNA
jgi:iron complex transport system substrate-binding protein